MAEEEGYDLILDVSGAVIYSNPDMDMDEKISAALHARG
ncbi:OmpH family outer membrane protein [bacterium]|nr:OmpH family outer membrane protein [bacterium]